MTEKQGFFSKYRLVIRRSSPLLKCMVLLVILLSAVALLALRNAILDSQAEKEALRAQAAQLESDNQHLEEKISQLGTIDSVIDIATRQLGLVDPDTEFYYPEN